MVFEYEIHKLKKQIEQLTEEILKLQSIINNTEQKETVTVTFDWKKKNFKLDDYKGSYAIHCKTKEEADNFCKYLHEHNRHWVSGESYLITSHWEMEKGGICYLFNDDLYIPFDYANRNRYTILNYGDFDWTQENTNIEVSDKKIFNLDDFNSSDKGLCCDTKEESDKFRVYLNKHNRKWASGDSYLTLDYWRDTYDGICYFPYENFYTPWRNALIENKEIFYYKDYDWEKS